MVTLLELIELMNFETSKQKSGHRVAESISILFCFVCQRKIANTDNHGWLVEEVNYKYSLCLCTVSSCLIA